MSSSTGKSPKISDLMGALTKRFPLDLAEDWDNVGFLLGDASQDLTGVVVSVNLGRESLDAALEAGANLIICHHPPIFKATLKMTANSHPFCFEALKNNICVAAFHTNFDLGSQATNARIAQLLGAEMKQPLAARQSSTSPESQQIGKFITAVPADTSDEILDKMVQALAKAGAGQIGDYSECSFSWPGQGTFVGGESTNPKIGVAGKRQKVAEKRLEMVFPWKRLEKIVEAARKVHPYEEMAYDVLKLEPVNKRGAPAGLGYGFIAELNGVSSAEFLKRVQMVFAVDSVELVGPILQGSEVKKVAFSPGSGSGFIGRAVAQGIDTYVTGEVGYHQMLEAKRASLSLILLGHSNSERFFVETMAQGCEDYFKALGSSFGLTACVKSVFEVVHKTHKF